MDPNAPGAQREQEDWTPYAADTKVYIPVWDDSKMQSKHLDYRRLSIIEVEFVEPDMFGFFELQFSEFVVLPSAALDWSSSNEGAKLINLSFWMSKTSLDIFYERDDVHMNEMNWFVLGFNYKETKDSRSLNDK